MQTKKIRTSANGNQTLPKTCVALYAYTFNFHGTNPSSMEESVHSDFYFGEKKCLSTTLEHETYNRLWMLLAPLHAPQLVYMKRNFKIHFTFCFLLRSCSLNQGWWVINP